MGVLVTWVCYMGLLHGSAIWLCYMGLLHGYVTLVCYMGPLHWSVRTCCKKPTSIYSRAFALLHRLRNETYVTQSSLTLVINMKQPNFMLPTQYCVLTFLTHKTFTADPCWFHRFRWGCFPTANYPTHEVGLYMGAKTSSRNPMCCWWYSSDIKDKYFTFYRKYQRCKTLQ